MKWSPYDVVVVGGGHAGAEAAAASANMGAKTLLVTLNIDTICQMSCNPAMGGVAKGQIVREIDALGGYSGIVTDKSMIQFRMLNLSKGPAMWSPRAQCDKAQFSLNWRKVLENTPNLSIWQDEVVDIVIHDGVVCGVITRMGVEVPARAVILTNGTFLNGTIFIGEKSWSGGRIGERSSLGLSDRLKEYGFAVERLKTGTPVRIDGRTIDFTKLVEQPGDLLPQKFSYSDTVPLQSQRPCFLAYTNEQTHSVLRTGFDRSPLYTGRIQGHGPRYCPSIEDKIVRFASKDRHQLFVEPEGWTTNSYYLNGFSSSLPLEVQVEALHTIPGFADAEIYKPGYAIEYDFFPPTQLKYTLETKQVENLYFAGQINGTTGYEEAACQGLMAGINAYLYLQEKDSFILSRDQAYIGVLIDDLINKGVDEPYRMFTSRAEYRILLRQDNADFRLTALSHSLGLASEERYALMMRKQESVETLSAAVSRVKLRADAANPVLESLGSTPLSESKRLEDIVSRPEVSLSDFMKFVPRGTYSDDIIAAVEIGIKYSGYIEREKAQADKNRRLEYIRIPSDFDFDSLQGLSIECRQKLKRYKPETIAQASRISGVSPSDISVLLVYFGR